MSHTPSLHPVVVEAFTRAFGSPTNHSGTNIQWSLSPRYEVAAVNVLVNIGNEHPSIWVFDPHDLEHGVASHAIHSRDQIAPLIASIEGRARAAGNN